MIANNIRSKIIIGCEPLGGVDWGEYSIDETKEAIKLAAKHEFNYYDTADVYGLGQSEIELSRLLHSYSSKVKIMTKVGVKWAEPVAGERANTSIVLDTDYLSIAFNNSINRLRPLKVDTLYIHWLDTSVNRHVNMNSALKWLNKLKNIGIIKNSGLCNIEEDDLNKIDTNLMPNFCQIKCSLLNHNLSLINKLRNNNIKVVIYGVLESGLLTGKYRSVEEFESTDRRSRTITKAFFKSDEYKETMKIIYRHSEINNISLVQSVIELTNKKFLPDKIIIGIKNCNQLNELLI